MPNNPIPIRKISPISTPVRKKRKEKKKVKRGNVYRRTMALDRGIVAMDLSRQKKEKVPKIPLKTRIQVRFPLRDIPFEERIGQRIAPPIRNRAKAICMGEKKKERCLARISANEKMIAERSISPKPLVNNRLRIILIVSVRWNPSLLWGR